MWGSRRYSSYGGLGGGGYGGYGGYGRRYGAFGGGGALGQTVWMPIEQAVRVFGQELTTTYQRAQMQLQQEFARLGASASQLTGGIFVPRGRYGGYGGGGLGGFGGGMMSSYGGRRYGRY